MWVLWGDVAVPLDRLAICGIAAVFSVLLWADVRP
jgi:hypothetical protein